MDEIMDTKVVQMKFDNSQFRAGVQDTIKQLEQLDNSLELQGASTGLDKVSKASKDTANSLTAVSDATQEVQRHFSALEIVGITVMMRLTNAALTYGSRMANNLWSKTFGQIISGGKARSQNIANAKFQLEGLGVAWKEIGEDINYGVKDTAYGLDEAAKAAAQMVASMDLANGYTEQQSAQMRIALRAISGVAAMTNSSYSEIADVFTTVSSNGKLMTMQLRQLAARGLNASAVLAKAMNKTEEEINNMVTQGKISFREFAEAMDDAFGAHAKEANKTFQGALSNVKAALSRIGAKFAEPVYENLRKIFNGLIPLINNINKALDPVVEAFTSIVNTGGDFLSKFLDLTDLARFFGQTILNIYGYIRPIIIAFFEVFAQYLPYVERGSRSMGDFAKQFALSGEQATKVRDVFRSVFGVIDLFIHVAISAFKILKTIGKGLITTFASLSGSMEPSLDILYNINTGLQRLLNIAVNFIQARLEKTFEAIANALKLVNWERILNIVGNVVVVLAVAWQLLLKLIELVIEGFKRLMPMLQIAAVLLGSFVASAVQGLMVVAGLVSNIFGRGKELVTNIIVRAQGLSNTSGIFNAGEAVQEMGDSTSNLNDSLSEATEEIDELNDRLDITEKNARRAGKSVDDLRKSSERLTKGGLRPKRGTDGEDPLDPIGLSNKGKNSLDPSWLTKTRADNTRTVGVFEYIATIFAKSRDSVLLKVGKIVDDFFFSLYNIVLTGFNEFIYYIQETAIYKKLAEVVDSLFGTPLKAIATLRIAALSTLIISIFKAIYGIIDFLPSIARSLARYSWAAVLHELSECIAAISVPILALAALFASVAAVTYMVGDVDQIKDIFEVLIAAVKGIVEQITSLITSLIWLSVALGALNIIMDTIPRILRVIRRQADPAPIATQMAKMLMSLALSIGAIFGAIYLMSYMFERFDPNNVLMALAIVTVITALLMLLSLMLARHGRAIRNGVNTITLTAKGLRMDTAVFHNSMLAISAGLATMLLTLTAVTAMLVRYISSESYSPEVLDKALQIVIAGIGVIVGTLGIITLYVKWMQHSIGASFGSEHAAKQVEMFAQSIKNVAKVLKALGFTAIELAAALWIISKIEYPENDRILKIFLWMSGIITAIAVVLPIILAKLGTDPGRTAMSIGIGISLMTTAMAGMFLAIAGMFKMLSTIEDYGNMPLKMIITLTSIVSFLILAMSIVGIVGKGSTALDDMFGATLVITTLSFMFLCLGQMFKVIGESISSQQIDSLTPLLITVTSIIAGIIALIAILGAIPATAGGTLAVLGVLSLLFIAMGIAFASVSWSISNFANIDWEWAQESAESMDEFVKTIGKAVKKIKLQTIIGLGLFSTVTKQIAKAIKSLDGVKPEVAEEAAISLGLFIGKIVEYESEIERLVSVSANFALIGGLIAAGMAGITVATALLDVTVLLIAAFVLAIELYGDRIGPALDKFIQTIIDAFKLLNDNADTFDSGILRFLAFAGTVFLAGGLLAAGAWLFVVAAIGMAKAGEILVGAFELFLGAYISVGMLIENYHAVIANASSAILAFGTAALITGGVITLVSLEFMAACIFFGIGVSAIGEGLYATGVYLNAALDEFNKFLDGIEDLKGRLETELNEVAETVSNSDGGVAGDVLNTMIFGALAPVVPDSWRQAVVEGGTELGMWLIDGFVNSIDDGDAIVQAAGEDLIEVHLLEPMEETAEVNSPSKRTYRLGGYIVQGLVDGMKANESLAINSGISIANAVISGLETIDDQIRTKGEMHAKAYSEGLNSVKNGGRLSVSGKAVSGGGGGDRDSSHTGRENNQYAEQVRQENEEMAESFDQSQAAAEGAQATTQAYTSEMENGLNRSGNVITNALGRFRSLFGLDMTGEGQNTVGTWFSSLLSNLGINAEGIKDKVFGLGTVLGTLFGDGIGKAVERACRAIAEMTASNLNQVQQEALDKIDALGGSTAAMLGTYYGSTESNRIVIEHDAMRSWRDTFGGMLDSLPSIDDILDFSVPSGGGYTPSTTSDMAAAIAGSSGAGSGINDQSKAASIGGGVGNTITNSNNTYNFYQNNYSPEPLNRSAIYQQTRQQLNGFYTYVKEKNLSY